MPVELVERDDAVKTGADGRFVLRGLDGFTQLTGLCIEHNDYHTYQFNLVGSAKDKADIGTTRLQLLPPGAPREAALTREERQRKLRIFGSVTDSQGKPVGPYRIVAAALPVPDWPLGYENEAKNVPAGKPWELPLVFDMESEDQVCWVWVMVASPGFASSVKVVPRENTDKPIELQLQRGFSLSGRIEGPAVAAGKAVVMLQPMYLFARNPPNGVGMRPDSPLCGIQVNRTSVEPNGTFSLSNLAPGTYILQVVAPGATPTERLITVRDKDLRLDSPLKMVPAGRIEGIMFDDEGRPEIMTSHEWVSPVALDPRIGEALWGKQRLDFDADNYMTDENGRFTIQNAPIGVNRLRFAYSEPPAIDYVANHDYLVRVLPDRATASAFTYRRISHSAGKRRWK